MSLRAFGGRGVPRRALPIMVLIGENKSGGGMRSYFRRHLSTYWRRDVGFALFLAWLYCTLFGCGLATPDPAVVGTPTQWCLERIWMFSGLAEGVCGALGLALSSRPRVRAVAADVRFAILAAGVSMLGSALVWVAWLERTTLFWQVHAIGGLVCSVGVALFTMVWGSRLGSDDEARIELAIPVSFGLAFVIYLALLFTKWSSVFTLVLCVALCAASAAFACRRVDEPLRVSGRRVRAVASDANGACTLSCEGGCEAGRPGPSMRDMLSFVVLAGALWFQIAYFRLIATPARLGNNFMHYLYPFAGACLASLVMVVLCIRISRYLNLSLAYRWGLPAFVLSYVPLIFGYDDPSLRVVAYAINFLGMFGVQYGCWLGASKWVRRMGSDPLHTFGAFSLGEGVGIFAGCALGLFVMERLSIELVMASSLLVLAVVCLAVMMVGFNPDALFRRTRGMAARDSHSNDEGAPIPSRVAVAAPSGVCPAVSGG